jgi:hypothetical protein
MQRNAREIERGRIRTPILSKHDKQVLSAARTERIQVRHQRGGT